MARQGPQCAFVGSAEFGACHHLLAGIAPFLKANATQRLQVGGLRNDLPAVCGVNHRQTSFNVQRQPLLAVIKLGFTTQRLGDAFGGRGIRD